MTQFFFYLKFLSIVFVLKFYFFLNLKGALINFANIQDGKLMLVLIQGNDVVCKIAADQAKLMNSLKQIIQRQKQQQMQRVK